MKRAYKSIIITIIVGKMTNRITDALSKDIDTTSLVAFNTPARKKPRSLSTGTKLLEEVSNTNTEKDALKLSSRITKLLHQNVKLAEKYNAFLQ